MMYFSPPPVGSRILFGGKKYVVLRAGNGSIDLQGQSDGEQLPFSSKDFKSHLQDGLAKIISVPTPPEHTSGAQRDRADRRLQYVTRLDLELGKSWPNGALKQAIAAIAINLDDPKPPSASSVREWRRLYQQGGCTVAALIPARRKRYSKAGAKKIQQELFDQIIVEISEERGRIDGVTVFERLENALHKRIAHNGLTNHEAENLILISKRTVQRWIKALDPNLVLKSRLGPFAAKRASHAAARSVEGLQFLDQAQGDGKVLSEVLLVDRLTRQVIGYAYLTLIFEVFSKAVIGVHVSASPFSGDTLLAAFKRSITEAGSKCPRAFTKSLVVDNGSDYLSDSFKNAYQSVAIAAGRSEGHYLQFAPPRNPNTKAHVERLFADVGNFLNGLKKRTQSRDNPAKLRLTIDELRSAIDEWCDHYNKDTKGGSRESPLSVWIEAEKKQHPIKVDAESARLYCSKVYRRRISNGRVRAENLEWFSDQLAIHSAIHPSDHASRTVDVLMDVTDLSEVRIRLNSDPDDLIVAHSTMPLYADGLTLAEHKLVKKNAKADRKGRCSAEQPELLAARDELRKRLAGQSERNRSARKTIERLHAKSKAGLNNEGETGPVPPKSELPPTRPPAPRPSPPKAPDMVSEMQEPANGSSALVVRRRFRGGVR